MNRFIVGQGSGEQVVVIAEGALAAAKEYAAEHPGIQDIFVSDAADALRVEAAGAWQDVRIFPRSAL